MQAKGDANSSQGGLYVCFGLLCFLMVGCAHHDAADSSNQASYTAARAETVKALELARGADLVIEYERSSAIRLFVPGQMTPITTTEEALGSAIAMATPKRELAVVLIGKPVRHEFPEPQLSQKADEIEAIVRAQGFTRVVFQLALGTGRGTYRE